MQLAEQQLLDLDASVAHYVAGFRIGSDDAGASMTIRQLLTHTSGLCDDYTPTTRDDDAVERYVADVVPSLVLESRPGEGFMYFFLDNGGSEVSLSQTRPGDVIYFNWADPQLHNGEVSHHTAVVTAVLPLYTLLATSRQFPADSTRSKCPNYELSWGLHDRLATSPPGEGQGNEARQARRLPRQTTTRHRGEQEPRKPAATSGTPDAGFGTFGDRPTRAL